MGPRVPRVLVNLVERKFACTRTKVQNHGEGWNDRSEEAREREEEREGGSGQRRFPFSGSMCHSCVLSVTREIPRSLLELLNRGNRKGNPISREGGGPWIEEEAMTMTTKGRESSPSPFWKIQIHRGTRSNRSRPRIGCLSDFYSAHVCIIERNPFSFQSSFFAFQSYFSNIFDPS